MEDFRPQVDGLRALAIAGALYYQFWNPVPLLDQARVTLVLAISGFVITHVLMTAREGDGVLGLANFYIRRLLRLAPPILLACAAAYVLDADGFRAAAFWQVLPLSNIYFALSPGQGPWPVSHFWSLSLLAQFYLLWPLVVLWLPSVGFTLFNILGIAALVFLRSNAEQLGIPIVWASWAFAADPILFGALACQMLRSEGFRRLLSDRGLLELSVLALVSPLFLWEGFASSESYRLIGDCAAAVIVSGAFAGYSGVVGQALQSGLARFLGRISYSAYVYHMVLWFILGQIDFDLYQKGPMTFVVLSTATLCLATLSWYLMEAPISRLKRHFPTREANREPALADQP